MSYSRDGYFYAVPEGTVWWMTCSKHTAQAQIIIVPGCPRVLRLELKVFNPCGEQNNNLKHKSHNQPGSTYRICWSFYKESNIMWDAWTKRVDQSSRYIIYHDHLIKKYYISHSSRKINVNIFSANIFSAKKLNRVIPYLIKLPNWYILGPKEFSTSQHCVWLSYALTVPSVSWNMALRNSQKKFAFAFAVWKIVEWIIKSITQCLL